MHRLSRLVHHPLVTLTAAIIAVIAAAIETDVFVPAFPAMAHHFAVSEAKIEMLVSINFLGLFLSSLFYGPLSDAIGRRNLLIAGLSIFVLGGVGAVYSESFNMLLFWRFIQGIGSAAAFVLPGAIIYDLYSQEKAAKILGFYNSLITIVMAGAPMLGSYLYLNYGWRANFVLVASIAVVALTIVTLFVKESLPAEKRQAVNMRSIGNGFKQLLTDRVSLGTLLIICGIFSSYMVYITNLSLILIEHQKMSEMLFPWHQGAVLFMFAMISVFSSRFITAFGMARVKMMGLVLNLVGLTALTVTATWFVENPFFITGSMCLYTMGFALMINIIFGEYMQRFPDIKGIASSLVSAARLLVNVAAISLSGLLFTGTIRPVVAIILGLTLASAWIMFSLQQKLAENNAVEAA